MLPCEYMFMVWQVEGHASRQVTITILVTKPPKDCITVLGGVAVVVWPTIPPVAQSRGTHGSGMWDHVVPDSHAYACASTHCVGAGHRASARWSCRCCCCSHLIQGVVRTLLPQLPYHVLVLAHFQTWFVLFQLNQHTLFKRLP